MKKLLFVAVFLMISGQVFAQQGLKFGARVMPQMVHMYNVVDNEQDGYAGGNIDYEPTWRVAFGANVGYSFNDNLGVMASLLYSPQGNNYVMEPDADIDNDGGPLYDLKLNYFKIPLLLRFNSDPTGGAAFLVEAGPQFGFLTGAAAKVGNLSEFAEITNFKDKYETFDLSLGLGLGTMIRIQDNMHIDFLLKFDYGFSEVEVQEVKAVNIGGGLGSGDARRADEKTNNMGVGLMLGFTYTL